ncbi:hypothetical protein [Oceanobacillus massiliensis]|uniref:hypothetical protein n=1 Tax=Oceanobacillus massiliensis TaxID=1465765 RepID=UPI000288A961|nr:hypothetical protein [Oceanobacillus massiliensis]
MSTSRIFKWITGIFEALLGIPILGGFYIIANGWSPLFVMLVLHIITWVLTAKDNGSQAGSILGVITSIIGWIPIIGMIMHIITAIVLLLSAMRPERKQFV